MNYETVIGLEIHAELATNTKIYCSCENKFGGAENTRCCPVCIGLPGTLPTLNKKVVEYGIKAGLAMNCKIASYCKQDRKNYFYPDLPKAYQMLSTDKWQARQRVYVVTTNSRVEKIPYREIYYLKKEGKYVLIVHQRGTSKVRKTLQDVVDELNANHFRIIERGFAVNMYHVMSFKDHQILVRDGSYLPVGKQRIQMVRKAIMEMGEDRWC